MIDIVTDKDAKLRNIKQIGSPQEEDRIYLSDSAYKQMHENNYTDKQVYVLMGHTENSNGRYATFVEAAIRVEEIEFERNVPLWNNQVWKSVFLSVKQQYENLIIVGWALDLKGFPPKENPELEKVHREHFGGIHQLLFLMNSLEQEEYFYMNKNNHLYKKSGFFIYYQVKAKVIEEKSKEEPKVNIEIPEELITSENVTTRSRGRYRELLNQQNQLADMTPCTNSGMREDTFSYALQDGKKGSQRGFSLGMIAAIAVLATAIGVNSFSDGKFSDGVKSVVETMGQTVQMTEEKVGNEKSIGESGNDEGDKSEFVIENNTETPTEKVEGSSEESSEEKIPVEEY